jgi:hypothetical protein
MKDDTITEESAKMLKYIFSDNKRTLQEIYDDPYYGC